jgi:hypothetical protein
MTLARTKPLIRLAATLLGGVLLVAGLLKASASFSALYHFGAVARADRIANTGLLILAMFEIAVAINLTQRPFRLNAWRVAFALFAAFFLVALSQALAGQQVCDCFGAVVLAPHYTAVFDLLATCICGAAARSLTARSLDLISPAWAGGTNTGRLYPSLVAFMFAFIGLLFLRESRWGNSRYGIPPVVAELQLDNSDSEDLWINGSALLATRGGEQVRVVGCRQTCGLRIQCPLPLVLTPKTCTRMPLLVRRPPQARVGMVPLTLFVEVRGALEKLTLPLLTPRLSK